MPLALSQLDVRTPQTENMNGANNKLSDGANKMGPARGDVK